MNRLFAGYGPWKGAMEGRRNGSLISNAAGEAVHYALFYLQERGTLFVSPAKKVYQGMILGEHSRGTDLEVNPIKEKKLTNIRAAGKDDAMLLIPPRKCAGAGDRVCRGRRAGGSDARRGAAAQAPPRSACAQARGAAGESEAA